VRRVAKNSRETDYQNNYECPAHLQLDGGTFACHFSEVIKAQYYCVRLRPKRGVTQHENRR
jgi:hypothetical protein